MLAGPLQHLHRSCCVQFSGHGSAWCQASCIGRRSWDVLARRLPGNGDCPVTM